MSTNLPWRDAVSAGTLAPNPVVDGGGIFGSIKASAPDILKIGGTILGGELTKSGNSDASAERAAALREAGNIVEGGLDDRQYWTEIGLNDIRNLLTTGYLDQSGQIRTAADTFEDANIDAVNAFRRAIMPTLSSYGRAQFNNVDEYGRDVDDASQGAAEMLSEGVGAYQDVLSPYLEAGEGGLDYTEDVMNLNAATEVPSDQVGSLGYFQQILATDPNELTQSQQFAKEDVRRDALANLAASGLRGAGRGGVATVSEALARLKAQQYDQNIRRQDDAARILANADLNAYNRNIQRKDSAADVLNKFGYQTTGNVATAYNNLAKTLGDMQFKTGMDKAGTEYAAASDISDRWYDQGSNISEKIHGASTSSAANSYNAATALANLTGQHYGNLADVASDRYTSRGNTSLQKANTRAGTLDSSANLDFYTNTANNKVDADTFGRIGGIINSENKAKTTGTTGGTQHDVIVN